MGTQHTEELFITSLAIIPARSGSQAIKHKNIKEFCGLPLIAYTIRAAKDSGMFSDIIVSTDSEDYANIARHYGASVPFLRAKELAHSSTPSSEVTLSTIKKLAELGKNYDYFAVLQATSPLRNASHIKESFSLLQERDEAEVVISVCKKEESPLLANTLPQDLSLKNFIAKEIRNMPRQQMPQYYSIRGAIFFAHTQAYLHNQDPYSMNAYAYVMPEEYSIDIDSITDFYLAELLYKKLYL